MPIYTSKNIVYTQRVNVFSKLFSISIDLFNADQLNFKRQKERNKVRFR